MSEPTSAATSPVAQAQRSSRHQKVSRICQNIPDLSIQTLTGKWQQRKLTSLATHARTLSAQANASRLARQLYTIRQSRSGRRRAQELLLECWAEIEKTKFRIDSLEACLRIIDDFQLQYLTEMAASRRSLFRVCETAARHSSHVMCLPVEPCLDGEDAHAQSRVYIAGLKYVASHFAADDSACSALITTVSKQAHVSKKDPQIFYCTVRRYALIGKSDTVTTHAHMKQKAKRNTILTNMKKDMKNETVRFALSENELPHLVQQQLLMNSQRAETARSRPTSSGSVETQPSTKTNTVNVHDSTTSSSTTCSTPNLPAVLTLSNLPIRWLREESLKPDAWSTILQSVKQNIKHGTQVRRWSCEFCCSRVYYCLEETSLERYTHDAKDHGSGLKPLFGGNDVGDPSSLVDAAFATQRYLINTYSASSHESEYFKKNDVIVAVYDSAISSHLRTKWRKDQDSNSEAENAPCIVDGTDFAGEAPPVMRGIIADREHGNIRVHFGAASLLELLQTPECKDALELGGNSAIGRDRASLQAYYGSSPSILASSVPKLYACIRVSSSEASDTSESCTFMCPLNSHAIQRLLATYILSKEIADDLLKQPCSLEYTKSMQLPDTSDSSSSNEACTVWALVPYNYTAGLYEQRILHTFWEKSFTENGTINRAGSGDEYFSSYIRPNSHMSSTKLISTELGIGDMRSPTSAEQNNGNHVLSDDGSDSNAAHRTGVSCPCPIACILVELEVKRCDMCLSDVGAPRQGYISYVSDNAEVRFCPWLPNYMKPGSTASALCDKPLDIQSNLRQTDRLIRNTLMCDWRGCLRSVDQKTLQIARQQHYIPQTMLDSSHLQNYRCSKMLSKALIQLSGILPSPKLPQICEHCQTLKCTLVAESTTHKQLCDLIMSSLDRAAASVIEQARAGNESEHSVSNLPSDVQAEIRKSAELQRYVPRPIRASIFGISIPDKKFPVHTVFWLPIQLQNTRLESDAYTSVSPREKYTDNVLTLYTTAVSNLPTWLSVFSTQYASRTPSITNSNDRTRQNESDTKSCTAKLLDCATKISWLPQELTAGKLKQTLQAYYAKLMRTQIPEVPPAPPIQQLSSVFKAVKDARINFYESSYQFQGNKSSGQDVSTESRAQRTSMRSSILKTFLNARLARLRSELKHTQQVLAVEKDVSAELTTLHQLQVYPHEELFAVQHEYENFQIERDALMAKLHAKLRTQTSMPPDSPIAKHMEQSEAIKHETAQIERNLELRFAESTRDLLRERRMTEVALAQTKGMINGS